MLPGPGDRPDDRAGPEQVICSARGCGQPAAWAVVWNNPRIHTPDREKIWTACDDHRDHLADYLGRRSMLRRVDALADLPAQDRGTASPEADPTARG